MQTDVFDLHFNRYLRKQVTSYNHEFYLMQQEIPFKFGLETHCFTPAPCFSQLPSCWKMTILSAALACLADSKLRRWSFTGATAMVPPALNTVSTAGGFPWRWVQPEISGAAVSWALALTEGFVFTPQTFCEWNLYRPSLVPGNPTYTAWQRGNCSRISHLCSRGAAYGGHRHCGLSRLKPLVGDLQPLVSSDTVASPCPFRKHCFLKVKSCVRFDLLEKRKGSWYVEGSLRTGSQQGSCLKGLCAAEEDAVATGHMTHCTFLGLMVSFCLLRVSFLRDPCRRKGGCVRSCVSFRWEREGAVLQALVLIFGGENASASLLASSFYIFNHSQDVNILSWGQAYVLIIWMPTW